jgi:hypothetical protein
VTLTTFVCTPVPLHQVQGTQHLMFLTMGSLWALMADNVNAARFLEHGGVEMVADMLESQVWDTDPAAVRILHKLQLYAVGTLWLACEFEVCRATQAWRCLPFAVSSARAEVMGATIPPTLLAGRRLCAF